MEIKDKPGLAEALGKVVSGVQILTLKSGDEESAMLASWVIQAGFEPPTLTMAVKKGRAVEELLRDGTAFCVNVLEKDNAGPFFKHYGKGFAPGENPYVDQEVRRGECGAGILVGALCYLEGEVRDSMDAGDHMIYLGEIKDGGMLQEGEPYVHVRKDGFKY